MMLRDKLHVKNAENTRFWVESRHTTFYTHVLKVLKGNFAIFYMLAKYVPGDIKYIFTKFYRHISTNNEAIRKFVILISNFSTRL
jgi:hypothetical protein